jgi:transposase
MSEKKRHRYDAELKRIATALSEESGRTAYSVEQSLGIVNGLIGYCKRQFAKNGELLSKHLSRLLNNLLGRC